MTDTENYSKWECVLEYVWWSIPLFATIVYLWRKSDARLHGQSKVSSGLDTETGLSLAVRRTMETYLEMSPSLGMQCVVFHRGKLVVHCWGGENVTDTSLFMAWSVSKGVAAMTLAIAASRGKLDYDASVSTAWPEFGACGKQQISIADAVSHRAGILHSYIPLGLLLSYATKSLLPGFRADWRQSFRDGLKLVETAKPAWTAGKWAAYHLISYSWIVGGIIEKQTGAHIRQCVIDYISKPLGHTSDMFLGVLPASEDPRVIKMVPENLKRWPKRQGLGAWVSAPLVWMWLQVEMFAVVKLANSKWWRTQCIPSSNGVWNAMSLARMYNAVACTRSEEASLLFGSEAKAAEVCTVFARNFSSVCSSKKGPRTAHRSLGFYPWLNKEIHGKSSTVLGHSGMGGSTAFADLDNELVVVLLKNAYTPEQIGLWSDEGAHFPVAAAFFDEIRSKLGLK